MLIKALFAGFPDTAGMKPVRTLLMLLPLLAVAAGATWQVLQSPTVQPVPADLARSLWPGHRPIAPFTLQRASGGVFTRADLEGRWTLMYFGYLQCPDVCPTTLAHMAAVRRHLAGSGAEAPQLVFLSVDPARDSAATIADYTGYFDPAIIGLRADEPALGAFVAPIGVYYLERFSPEGTRSVEHTTAVILVDPDARAVAGITLSGRPDEDGTHLRRLMAAVAR